MTMRRQGDQAFGQAIDDLAAGRIERNDAGEFVAADPRHALVLADLRARYDAELAAIAGSRVEGHDYEKYPVLFSRTIPWTEKPAAPQPAAGKGKRKAGKADDR